MGVLPGQGVTARRPLSECGMLRSALAAMACLALLGCTPALDPPMTRSCRGEYVNECRPQTYASISAASLMPERITLDDPSMTAMVHVEFTECAMVPSDRPLHVEISAFVGGTTDASFSEPDGGSSGARVIPLATVGPPAPGATSIDVTIPNPFFANVPADRNITLQFAPIVDGCQGELVSVPYHTGIVLAAP
jgi:hypothetical protein